MRIRISFAKQDALRYTGHLDLHHIWERAARRADLPLAYSRGFHPQPKLNLAAALPLGFSSRSEVMDMRLDSEVPLEGLQERIQAAVPLGLQIIDVRSVDEKLPALQTLIEEAEYEVHLTEAVDASDLSGRISLMLQASSLPRERRGKVYDMRPLIKQASLMVDPAGDVCLRMRLSARPSATGRPDEVLDQLGISPDTTRIERIRLIFQDSSVQ